MEEAGALEELLGKDVPISEAELFSASMMPADSEVEPAGLLVVWVLEPEGAAVFVFVGALEPFDA